MIDAIIARVKGLLLAPSREWEIIDGEAADVSGIYQRYVLPLAAVGAIASFIGMSVFGMSFGGVTVRLGLVEGLFQLVLSLGLTLVWVYVFALIVDALAPSFGAQKNMGQAFKLSAYFPTPSWILAIVTLIPALGILGLAGLVWSLALLFKGLPRLMKPAPDKATPYTLTVIAISILASLVIGFVVGALGPKPDFTTRASGGGIDRIATNDPRAAGDLERAAREFEETGDLSGVLGALSGATGGGAVAVIETEALKAFAPERLGGFSRTETAVERIGAPAPMAMLSAEYADGEKTVSVTVNDFAGFGGAMALAGFATGATYDRQTDDGGRERVSRKGDDWVMERYDPRSKEAAYARFVAKRFLVAAESDDLSVEELERLVERVDLAGLRKAAAK